MNTSFAPWPALVPGRASEDCRAVVILPARNEQAGLAATLDALAAQVDLAGRRLHPAVYEVLLLLNNCTDASAVVARAWQRARPEIVLHVAERALLGGDAHVGTARRLLMDTAWRRLGGRGGTVCGILSTDSDTVVAPDWVAANLRALEAGADAVGGVIELKPGELERLPDGARRAYGLDREYQGLVAELEDLLDPQPGDPWPRHLENFGASLACTPAAYERAGGLPAVNPLEDMAFVDALRRVDARIRRDPRVRVFTSARLDGRAEVGLSWQLRTWQLASEAGEEPHVSSAAFLRHRFETRRGLRELYRRGPGGRQTSGSDLSERFGREMAEASTEGAFLQLVRTESLVEESFGEAGRDTEMQQAVDDLKRMLRDQRQGSAPAKLAAAIA